MTLADSGQDSDRRVVLVTGASGAIGLAIARLLAARAGYRVVLICRDEEKAQRCVRHIQSSTGAVDTHYELADLSRRSSIQDLARRWVGPLDVLVNNAAVAPRRRETTVEGIERQFATNVLGYLWMTEAFVEPLSASDDARIVNVASYWAGGLDVDDLEFQRRTYDNDAAYRQSKQANRMLTAAFAERLRPRGISVNACHPGDVNSTLSNSLGFGGHESPEVGARTPVWLASDAGIGGKTGKYFERRAETRCPFMADTSGVQALYDACQSYAA